MGSVYRPRPFDRISSGGPPTPLLDPVTVQASPGRDNTDRPVTTRRAGCGNRQAVVARRADQQDTCCGRYQRPASSAWPDCWE